MPLSQTALSALQAAAEWNTFGARELLAILREHPGLVRYKADKYGPLGLIIIATQPRRQLPDGSWIPLKANPFPATLLASCRVFAQEWREHKFTKRELADALQQFLDEEKAGRA